MATTLTATVTSTHDVRLVASSDNPSAHEIRVYRTMRSTSTQVRAWPLLDGGAWAHNDIDVLFNIPLTYIAEIYDDQGALLESSPEQGPVTVSHTSALLRDALLPTSSLDIRLVGQEAGDGTSDVQRQMLRPVGRQAPVVITDVRTTSSGQTSMLTLTRAEHTALNRMLDTGNVLLFTGPEDFDLNWPLYLSFGSVSVSRVSSTLVEARLFTLDWTEVDPPPVIEPAAAQTWQDLLDDSETWQTLRGSSWLDVLYPPAGV